MTTVTSRAFGPRCGCCKTSIMQSGDTLFREGKMLRNRDNMETDQSAIKRTSVSHCVKELTSPIAASLLYPVFVQSGTDQTVIPRYTKHRQTAVTMRGYWRKGRYQKFNFLPVRPTLSLSHQLKHTRQPHRSHDRIRADFPWLL